LKEKTLAALRAGIKRVIIPEGNASELEEMPTYVKRNIQFLPVKDMDGVMKILFGEKTDRPEKKKRPKKGATRERSLVLRKA
jgi:ATP-dependent Lon protease